MRWRATRWSGSRQFVLSFKNRYGNGVRMDYSTHETARRKAFEYAKEGAREITIHKKYKKARWF